MKLTNKRVEELFTEIKTGLRVLKVKGFVVYLKYPSPALIAEVTFFEEEIRQKYEKLIPTKSEISDKFSQKIQKEKNIQDLDYLMNKEIKLSKSIEHFEKMGMTDRDQTLKYYLEQHKSILKEIEKSKAYQKEANSLLAVKDKALSFCFETKINQATITYYIQRSVFFRRGTELLPLFNHLPFKNVNERMEFINLIFEDFVKFMQGHDEKELRALARSSYVSSLFKISNKTNVPLFDGTASDYNQLQINLLSWCDYYHSIFTNLGAPERHIIEDDALFDKWLENKLDEMKSSDKKSKNNSNNNKNTNLERIDKFIFKEPTRALDSTNLRKI